MKPSFLYVTNCSVAQVMFVVNELPRRNVVVAMWIGSDVYCLSVVVECPFFWRGP